MCAGARARRASPAGLIHRPAVLHPWNVSKYRKIVFMVALEPLQTLDIHTLFKNTVLVYTYLKVLVSPKLAISQ